MKLAPGDAVRDVLGVEDVAVNQDVIDAQREEMGFNRPLLTQYREWLFAAIQLDFGQSFMTRRPVTEEIITRVPATLLLTGTSVLVMLSISIPIGILSSFKSLSVINQFGRIFAVVGTSIPGFWLGILLIELFSVRLGWLPSMGTGSIRHLILPSLALGLTMAAVYVRMIRSSMTISMEKEFVRGARARGLSSWRVTLNHGFRHALSPLLGYFSVTLGSLLGGTVVIEVLFSYPGLGKFAIDAIHNRDYPVIQGYMVAVALLITLFNVLNDALQVWLQPESRRRG
ncbi:oligopeptide transport system permease protein OppB [Bacillus sp. JCM 19047]|nr:oligopeptide transport system permease protein OppB [Bacillus sp. JCM 19047]